MINSSTNSIYWSSTALSKAAQYYHMAVSWDTPLRIAPCSFVSPSVRLSVCPKLASKPTTWGYNDCKFLSRTVVTSEGQGRGYEVMLILQIQTVRVKNGNVI